jgi:putative peptidoglycan lipid II flippase
MPTLKPASVKKSVKVLKRIPIGNAAALLVGTAMVGQVLGFLRTKLINANFSIPGPNNSGVYFAAFNIPDLFFYTIAAGALGVTVMPYLSDRLHHGDRRGMWELSTSILNLLSLLTLVVGIVILIFARPLIRHFVAPGLSPAQLDNATMLMRFLALNPFFFTISGVLASAQQTLGRFFFFAIAPLFYNLAIIGSIYLFKDTSLGIVGLGVGACLGSILQLAVVLSGLVGTKFHWKPIISWRSADFRSMLRQLPARSLDQGIDQVQSLVETNFASRLSGAVGISNYNNAFILHTAPILLLGTAISTAAFPRLNQRLSQGRPDLFRKDFLVILRAMIWITMPVVVICFFGRGYLARIIFSNDAPDIALIFGFLTVAILFRTMYTLISRWFYAQKDTKTPLLVSLFTISLNIWLAYTLSRPSAYGIAGLALAQSIVAMTEVAVLSTIMLIRDHKLFDMQFWGGCARIVSVTGFSVVAASTVVALFPLGTSDSGTVVGVKLLFITVVTLGIHVGLSALFGLDEVKPIFRRVRLVIRRFILRPVKIGY